MPNGIVTMLLPSGITDSAVRKIAKMKNASWKLVDVDGRRAEDALDEAHDELALDRSFTMAPIFAR